MIDTNKLCEDAITESRDYYSPYEANSTALFILAACALRLFAVLVGAVVAMSESTRGIQRDYHATHE